MAQNLIYSINGPVVTIKGKTGLSMMEMVHVGNDHLVGEVIRMDEELTTIQVYEAVSYTHLAHRALRHFQHGVRLHVRLRVWL